MSSIGALDFLKVTRTAAPLSRVPTAVQTNSEAQLHDAELTERSKPVSSVNEFIQAKLSPRLIEDNDGYSRTIFNHNGFSFSFRGNEEQWTHNDVNNFQTIGSRSKYLENNPTGSAENKFLVSKTAEGALDLALKFQGGNKDPDLSRMREELRNGEYSDMSLRLIDAILALNFNGESFDLNNDGSAEAITALALSGDTDAQKLILSKLKEVQGAERRGFEEYKTEFLNGDDAVPDTSNWFCTHATKYKPNITEDGTAELDSSFNASEGKSFRTSVHFAVNQRVGGHANGNWDAYPITVIAPFNELCSKENGNPYGFQRADAWWVTNPGQKLKVPNAIIIQPGSDEQVATIDIQGRTYSYKTTNYSMDDLNLISCSNEGTASLTNSITKRVANRIRAMVMEPYNDTLAIGDIWNLSQLNFDLDPPPRSAPAGVLSLSFNTKTKDPLLEKLIATGAANLDEACSRFLENISFESYFTVQDGVEFTKAQEDLKELLKTKIQDSVRTSLSIITSDQAILDNGGSIISTDSSGVVTNDSNYRNEDIALAKSLKMTLGKHTYTSNGIFEKPISDRLAQLERKEINNPHEPQPISSASLKIDVAPETRRCFYSSGLHLARAI